MKDFRLKWWLWRLFRKNETKVHELNYLFWECTTRCNLACRHCGSDCTLPGSRRDMPLDDFLKALDTIPRKEVPREFTVVLTGGEPLLRPDLEEIGKSIRRQAEEEGCAPARKLQLRRLPGPARGPARTARFSTVASVTACTTGTATATPRSVATTPRS